MMMRVIVAKGAFTISCMFVKLNRRAAIKEMEQRRAVGYKIINIIRNIKYRHIN